MQPIILPVTYLGPISYYYFLVNHPVIIECHAHYVKQTYANRCQILTANGVQSLTIPIEHRSEKCAIKDVGISNHTNWQIIHWRAIETAYNATPFFEYYKDSLQPLFEQPHHNLFSFNLELQQIILDLLGFKSDLKLSENYIKKYNTGEIDLREELVPKKNSVTLEHLFEHKTYYQNFNHKHDFTPDLSIIDLLFNMGNEARLVLKKQ